ncbi:hypothetical protein KJ966_06280 [bacterium]|nr:hypothetical protein [bacterium]
MEAKIIINRDQLLEISERKVKLLQSVISQFEYIESNPVFIEEISEAYLDLDLSETELINEEEKKIACPECAFECCQIHSFCMACGAKLPNPFGMAV